MAKNDKKHDVKSTVTAPQDTLATPEKVADSADVSAAKAETKAAGAAIKPETAKISVEKKHGWRNFVLFLLLVLFGVGGFFVWQTQQDKQQNAQAMQKLQAVYEEKISEIGERVKVLEKEVKGLKERPIVEHAAGISENQLNKRLAALQQELEMRLQENENKKSVSEPEANATAGVTEVAAAPRVMLEQQVVSAAVSEQKTQEVLLASGAIIVRDLAEQGMNFAYEAEVLQILARGNELAEGYARTVRSFANTGLNGKKQLMREFNKVFADLNQSEVKNEPKAEVIAEDAKWYDKALFWLKKAFVAQKVTPKPVFVSENDEVWSLVDEGRLNEALTAIKTSEKYAKMNSLPLEEWKKQVSRYLEFESAINGLIMNALANIRLKEMEHAAQ